MVVIRNALSLSPARARDSMPQTARRNCLISSQWKEKYAFVNPRQVATARQTGQSIFTRSAVQTSEQILVKSILIAESSKVANMRDPHRQHDVQGRRRRLDAKKAVTKASARDNL